MAKRNAAGQDFTNNSDGWDLTGGTTPRKLTVSGADIAITGAGSFTYTFPGLTCYLNGIPVPTSLTSNTTLSIFNLQPQIILVNAAGGAFNITLPTAASISGAIVAIKRINSGANVITILTTSSETIDGSTTYSLDSQYKTVYLVSDGSNWQILAEKGAASGTTFTTVEVDLGSAKKSGNFTITSSGLTTSKQVMIFQATGPYTNKGTLADETEMDGVTVSGVVTNSTTIKCYWTSATTVKGNFKFNYLVNS
jgi:hypothetical protein